MKTNMNAAVVALVRGYKELDKYDDLLRRNSGIFKHINSKLAYPLKLILFHEGNISTDHQNYILSNSPEDIEFINVSSEFSFNKNIVKNAIDSERFKEGYRMMCRFNFYGIWNYVKDFDYIIRVDEDVVITKFDMKNLDKILDKKIVFSTLSLSKETHEPTNDTLPDYLMNTFSSKDKRFYNHKFPYTNFYISRVDFWNNSTVQQQLKSLVTEDQFVYRWGDLPIIGSFLNFYNRKINILNNCSYIHTSHNVTIKNENFLKKIFKK